MSTAQLGHRGRLLAAAVAAVLAVAAVVLAIVATTSQQHAASPAASAANPARERTLGSATPGPSSATVRPAAAPAVVGQVMRRSLPVSLDVPKLGIRHASLLHLPLAKDGSIQVPPVGANSPAGWFNGSPTPGQLGPSVILGHVDSAASGPAIFFRLSTLRPGDVATVTRADHTVAVFRVDSVEEYAKSAFPSFQVFGNTDHAALRLITCGGKFNPAKASYENNIVVYAHLASSHRA